MTDQRRELLNTLREKFDVLMIAQAERGLMPTFSSRLGKEQIELHEAIACYLLEEFPDENEKRKIK
jgi:hypothetical protein